jgi:hypothetical protein
MEPLRRMTVGDLFVTTARPREGQSPFASLIG